MQTIHPPRPPGQGGARADDLRPPIPERTSAPERPPRTRRTGGILGGHIRAACAFLDHRGEPLTSAELRLLLNIEANAWGACYAFPSDEELAERMGLSVRQVQRIVNALIAKGYLVVVMTGDGRAGEGAGRKTRLAFLLLKRADRDRPVFDPDRDSLDEIVGAVCQKRGIPKPRFHLKKPRAVHDILSPTVPDKMSPTVHDILSPTVGDIDVRRIRGIGGEEKEERSNNHQPDPVVVVPESSLESRKTSDADADDEASADAVATRLHRLARERVAAFRDLPFGVIAGAIEEHGAERVDLVLVEAEAQRAESWGFCVTLLKKWKAAGGPTTSKRAATVVQQRAAARRSAEAEARRKAEAEAEQAQFDAMTPAEREAEAARLLGLYRGAGRDLRWVEGRQHYEPVTLKAGGGPIFWADLDRLMQYLRAEIRSILDAERARPDYVDPLEKHEARLKEQQEAARQRRERQLEEQRLKAEADARARRAEEVRGLIDQAGRYYFAITDAGDGLELADAFPAGDVPPDEKARVERAKLCRQSIRGRLLRELNEAAAEVREALAARSEVAP